MKRLSATALAGFTMTIGSSIAFGVLAPAARASGPVTASPGTVTIQTVPALPGVHFSLDGVQGVTAADGSAAVSDRRLDTAAQDLIVPGQQLNNSLRVSLDRVVNDPDHPLFHRLLLVDLDEDRAVKVLVTTPEGAVLPAAEVTSVTLQDSLGRTLQLNSKDLAGPAWLASRRTVPDAAGVAARDVVYTVSSVVVHGSNIVSAGRYHFEPEQTADWKVPGIFFTLTVQGDDILGGKPAGRSMRLVYPDHSAVEVPLDSHHRARITDLPRGNYSLRVRGGLVGLTSQVRLSRNQLITQVVITTGDALVITLAGLGVIAVLAGTGMAGRHLRRTRKRPMELSGAPA